MNVAVPADYRMKMKESKKIVKYMGLARGLKLVCNIVTIALDVVGTIGMVSNNLKKEWRTENQKKNKTIKQSKLFRIF